MKRDGAMTWITAVILISAAGCQDPKQSAAFRQLAQIALLNDDLDAAERWLANAQRHGHASEALTELAAECAYRRNDFKTASIHFRSLGQVAKAD